VVRQLVGIGVSPGVASGPVARLAPPPSLPRDGLTVTDPPGEIAAARSALEEVAADLEDRSSRVSRDAAGVLAAQAAMARDPLLVERITERVKAGRPAPVAVDDALGEFRTQLAAAGGYMAERAADLDDVRDRALAVLLGTPMPGIPVRDEPFVLVAADLAPADTVTLDSSRVLAIVTERGGPTSHTAIISKSLGIPAVVACPDAHTLTDGQEVLIDGSDGTVIVEPGEASVADHMGRLAARAALTRVSGPGRTADGTPVQLLLNIGADHDVTAAAAADSEGVGLLRTEFLFLDRADAPDVEEQRLAYRRVFEAFTGRKVVVRTLDAGADKPLRFVTMPHEPNPALGMRGLRTARRFPDLLDDQLRSIARAAAGSRVGDGAHDCHRRRGRRFRSPSARIRPAPGGRHGGGPRRFPAGGRHRRPV
jgi:phosphotransferase system enzyme I (PtsI)